MPRYLVFPKGYCPMTAAGPPPDWFKKEIPESVWTPEVTQKHREMEHLATIEFSKPQEGFWSWDISEEKYDGKTVSEILQMETDIDN